MIDNHQYHGREDYSAPSALINGPLSDPRESPRTFFRLTLFVTSSCTSTHLSCGALLSFPGAPQFPNLHLLDKRDTKNSLHTTPMVRVLFTSALATAATLLAAVQATQGLKLYGVNYNIRSGPDWAPDATKCKSADVIDQELAKLKTITDTIRLYSLSDCDQAVKVIPAANKAGLKVTLGLWVGPDPATFAAEKLKLEELLSQDGLVTATNTPAIYVGSEAILRKEVNATTAIANIKEVRALCAAKQLSVPITLADTADVILKNPKLIDAVDFVSPNIFPFWTKVAASKGPAQLYGKIEQLVKIAKGKDIVISETGYPSDGTVEKGYPSATMANAATYFQGFYDLAQKHSLKYYYFAGFDEAWKLSSASANSSIEAYFGIFDKDGKVKDAYKALKPAAATLVPSPSSDAGAPTTSTAAPATKAPVATPAPVATSSPSKAPVVTGTPAAIGTPSVTPSVTAAPAKEAVISGGKVDAGGDDVYVPGAVSGKDVDVDASGGPVQTSFVPTSTSSSAGKTATMTAAPVTTGKTAMLTAAPATAAPAAPITATATAASAAPTTAAPAAATAASAAPAKGLSEGPAASGKKKRKDCDA